MPKNQYKAKKILCQVGMEYQKIHACPNDCILYKNHFAEMRKCPTCGVSRYKVNNDECNDDATINNSYPTKLCWYLPNDGLLRHLTDSLEWKAIDHLYPNFGDEPRNLRLGLASDGMNPFGNLNTNHSSWPILLMIYNLLPWLCIKQKYMMLCMMIEGPR